MPDRILITGGAGFIGSHLANRLLEEGHHVRALDSLIEQVHEGGERPGYLSPDVELLVGDVRDRDAVDRALEGVDAVVHLAARVGVGQSMYEIDEYTDVNSRGTGVLLEALMDRSIRKLVVASSMSVYGEGRYVSGGRAVEAVERSRADLERGEWEPTGPNGESLEPRPTDEAKQPALTSIYALNKYDQERMCLLFGSAYGVPTVALRFFNVYGRHQALSNPYTGVLAIFANRLLNDRPPLIYEDGGQRRDFVHVSDVAGACSLALRESGGDGMTLNVGSGDSVTVNGVASRLAEALGREIEPEVTGKFRAGDIRHCFADIGRAREAIGFEPRMDLGEGMEELCEWLEGQTSTDRVDDAARELAARGLTV